MFGSRPGTTQNALSINATGGVLGNWVSINGYTGSKVGNTYASATVYGTGSRTAIMTHCDIPSSPDLFMQDAGSLGSGKGMFFLSNANSELGGSVAGTNDPKFDFREGDYRSDQGNSLLQLTAAGRFNIPNGTHYKLQEGGANVLEIENDTGKLILGNNSNATIHLDTAGTVTEAEIGWNGNDLLFKKAGTEVFGIGANGALLAGGSQPGSAGQVLTSNANSAVSWEDIASGGSITQFVNHNNSPGPMSQTYQVQTWIQNISDAPAFLILRQGGTNADYVCYVGATAGGSAQIARWTRTGGAGFGRMWCQCVQIPPGHFYYSTFRGASFGAPYIFYAGPTIVSP